MANTTSAKKALRQAVKNKAHNDMRMEAYKALRREITKLVKAGDLDTATAKLPEFYREVDKSAKHNGHLHANTAARYKSRMATLVAKATTK